MLSWEYYHRQRHLLSHAPLPIQRQPPPTAACIHRLLLLPPTSTCYRRPRPPPPPSPTDTRLPPTTTTIACCPTPATYHHRHQHRPPATTNVHNRDLPPPTPTSREASARGKPERQEWATHGDAHTSSRVLRHRRLRNCATKCVGLMQAHLALPGACPGTQGVFTCGLDRGWHGSRGAANTRAGQHQAVTQHACSPLGRLRWGEDATLFGRTV